LSNIITSIIEDKSGPNLSGPIWRLNVINKKTGGCSKVVENDTGDEKSSPNSIVCMYKDTMINLDWSIL
jgi:hypothetical protein